jgi:hypothetical protein
MHKYVTPTIFTCLGNEHDIQCYVDSHEIEGTKKSCLIVNLMLVYKERN